MKKHATLAQTFARRLPTFVPALRAGRVLKPCLYALGFFSIMMFSFSVKATATDEFISFFDKGTLQLEANKEEKTQQEKKDEELRTYIDLFVDILTRARAQYVEEVNEKELMEAAIKGMLSSLDSYTVYLNPEQFADTQVNTKGEFAGLGIEVNMEDGFVKVISPIDDTPAYRAGVKAGDLITYIDDDPVQGMTLSTAISKMRGKPKTPITITVIRRGEDAPLKFNIIRDIIQITTVKYRREGLEKNIGYIRLTAFNQQATTKVKEAIKSLNAGKQPLTSYILDLRNNPGGLLTQAIAISDIFLNQGEIVSVRGDREQKNASRYSAKQGDAIKGLALVVLINGGSASASEIVAGALQDHHRATIIGTRSFGKGAVQNIFPLENDGAVKITTSRYYTPAQTLIEKVGITPDIVVKQKVGDDTPKITEKEKHLTKIRTKGRDILEGFIPRERKEDEQLTTVVNLLSQLAKNKQRFHGEVKDTPKEK